MSPLKTRARNACTCFQFFSREIPFGRDGDAAKDFLVEIRQAAPVFGNQIGVHVFRTHGYADSLGEPDGNRQEEERRAGFKLPLFALDRRLGKKDLPDKASGKTDTGHCYPDGRGHLPSQIAPYNEKGRKVNRRKRVSKTTAEDWLNPNCARPRTNGISPNVGTIINVPRTETVKS